MQHTMKPPANVLKGIGAGGKTFHVSPQTGVAIVDPDSVASLIAAGWTDVSVFAADFSTGTAGNVSLLGPDGLPVPMTVFKDPRNYGIYPNLGSDLTSKFATAMAAMTAGDVLVLPPGQYKANLQYSKGGIAVVGTQMPEYDGVSALRNGTIIIGSVDLNDQPNILFANIGVDQSTLADSVINGITQGSVVGTALINQRLENIAICGRGYATHLSTHSILLNKHPGYLVKGIKSYNFGHAIALKQGYGDVSDIYSYDCELSSVIVKSDANDSLADVKYVNLSNIRAKCSGSVALAVASIQIQSVDAGYKTQHINVVNANLENHLGTTTYPVFIWQSAGICSDINLANINVNTSASDRAFGFVSGSRISVSNAKVANATGYSFYNSAAAGVSLHGCHSVTPGTADAAGTFDVAEINGVNVAAISRTSGVNKLTSGNAALRSVGNFGSVNLYKYAGSSGLFYATQMQDESQGSWSIKSATAAAAPGSETYNVTAMTGLGDATNGPQIGIGSVTPSARMTLPAGIATAGYAPLKLTAGVNLSVVENGTFEFDGTNLYFSVGGVRKTVTLV